MRNAWLDESQARIKIAWRGTLRPPSDVYVRHFLCPFFTLIKLYYTKALGWSCLVPGPKAKSSSSEITNLTSFTRKLSRETYWIQQFFPFHQPYSSILKAVHIIKAMVFPVVMHNVRNRTIKKAEHQRIDAFKLWCWRRLLRVPWTAMRLNQFKSISSFVFSLPYGPALTSIHDYLKDHSDSLWWTMPDLWSLKKKI